MDMTAERAEKIPRSTEKPASTAEAQPRSPFRRRLLKVGVGVLAAELAGVGALWGKDQFDQFFARPTTPNEVTIPELPSVEPNIPASEKAINKVPLAEITKKQGFMSIVDFGGQTTADWPYGFSLSFQDLTIVHVEKNGANVWVALAMPGEKLEREQTGRFSTNFDGTKTEQFLYKGFTAWILVNNEIFFKTKGSSSFSNGIAGLESSLKVGKTISFNTSINQHDKVYQDMNKKSFETLSENIGKLNDDRSDQTFKFLANFATIST